MIPNIKNKLVSIVHSVSLNIKIIFKRKKSFALTSGFIIYIKCNKVCAIILSSIVDSGSRGV